MHRCYQRNGKGLVTGCTAGSIADDKVGYDFCYDPAKTRTKPGNDGCSSTKRCNTCQGDCDSDADCASGLKCFQRSKTSTLVPGCAKFGTHDDGKNPDGHATDYCYNPGSLVSKGVNGCSAGNKCARCEGDCDSDDQCTAGLKCYQRNTKKAVTGCDPGGSGDTSGFDYCFDPSSLVNRGVTGCTPSKKCGACQGDCDVDNDCAYGLKCVHVRFGPFVQHTARPGMSAEALGAGEK